MNFNKTHMKIYSYIHGEITTSDKLFVSAYDIGLLRGYAIYEGITTRNGKPFFLTEHLKRFRKSASQLDLKVPLSNKKIVLIIEKLTKINKFERSNFRMILSGGKTIDGIQYNKNKPTFFILAEKWKSISEDIYDMGGKLIVEEYQRFMPESKTTHYITAVKLQTKRKNLKAIEILYISKNKVLECSTSNIFIFKGNTLITPQNNILLGITRLVVLRIAKKHFKIEERDITADELREADEIFITSSYKDIVPITKVENKKIGLGVVGKNTRFIMEMFSNFDKN